MRKFSITGWAPYIPVGVLLLFGFATAWKMLALGHIPETPNNDLARHVASILNFEDAILDGQIVPRLQLAPAAFPDIPVFQFYGFLVGLLSLPFLIAGTKPIAALVLGVIFIRWLAAISLYRAGRLLGANGWGASLASISYLLTPYIISTLYGRVAIPEAEAHGVLAILFYGIIRLYVKGDVLGVIVIGLAIVLLSLAHPIFLLFGLLAAAAFSVFLFRWDRLWFAGLVILGGLLLASFQWVPGFLYYHDFAINFASASPFERRYWTSVSGLFGLPRSLVKQGLPGGDRLFLTPGILTIPVLALMAIKMQRPISRATFGLLLGSLIVSFSPIDIWRFLPHTLWTVQFPYRLLAFVALSTSIGICLVLKNIHPYQWGVIVAILIGQNWILLTQQPYSTPLASDKNIKMLQENFSNLDYVSGPPIPVVYSDGWLRDYATPLYDGKLKLSGMIGDDGVLLGDNSFAIGITRLAKDFIRISGKFEHGVNGRTYRLWVGHADNPLLSVGSTRSIHADEFAEIFEIPNDGRPLTLKCSVDHEISRGRSPQQGCPRIFITRVEHLPGNGFAVSGVTHQPTTLIIDGASIFEAGTINLWLARPTSPDTPVTESIVVGPGPFRASLTLPGDRGLYMLVSSRYMIPALVMPASQDDRRLSISIRSLEISAGGGLPPIEVPSLSVHRVGGNGYTRIFEVKTPQQQISSDAVKKEGAIVQLPMAFSRLISITQNGRELNIASTFSGLIYIKTYDLSSPIVAKFRLPQIAIVGTLLGMCFLILASLLCLRASRRVAA